MANTTATSAFLAAATAAGMPDCDGVCQPKWISWLNSPNWLEYSISTGTGVPAVRWTVPCEDVARADQELRRPPGTRAERLSCDLERGSPASLIVKRYRPVSVGVSVPVHFADHVGATPLGGLVRSTVGSTSVIAGAPLDV